jgi:hypothetical protein
MCEPQARPRCRCGGSGSESWSRCGRGGRTTVLLLRKNDSTTYHSGSKTFAIPLVISPRICSGGCNVYIRLLHGHTSGDQAKPSQAAQASAFAAVSIGAEPKSHRATSHGRDHSLGTESHTVPTGSSGVSRANEGSAGFGATGAHLHLSDGGGRARDLRVIREVADRDVVARQRVVLARLACVDRTNPDRSARAAQSPQSQPIAAAGGSVGRRGGAGGPIDNPSG